jgi:hypothetical protein
VCSGLTDWIQHPKGWAIGLHDPTVFLSFLLVQNLSGAFRAGYWKWQTQLAQPKETGHNMAAITPNAERGAVPVSGATGVAQSRFLAEREGGGMTP